MTLSRPLNLQRLSLAILLAMSQGAGAQSSSDDQRHEEEELDAVVVTASPLRQNAEQLSEPVAVLTGPALDDQRATTLGDTLRSIPGVQSSNFGPGVGRPIIRGLDGARVAVLSGGLATQDVSTISQDHAPTIEPFLADQIEVLKGPATLIHGSGAIGGVVNVVDGRIAESPLDPGLTGRAELRYDEVNDGRTALGRVDLAGTGFVLHGDVLRRRQDDYDLPDGGRQANSFVDTDSGALGGTLVGDWGFFGVSISRFENNYGNPGEPGDPDAGEAGVTLDIEQDRYEFKGGLNEPFGGVRQLRFSVAHSDYGHIEFEGDEVGTQFSRDGTEARFELTHGDVDGLHGAFGLQYADSELEAIGEEAFIPPSESDALGGFWVGQWQRDSLQLDFGARLDRVDSEAVGVGQRDFDPLSLSLGAVWRLSESWHLIGNLDRAERAPAEEELFSNGPHVATAAFEIGDPELEEERSNQIELGLHYHDEQVEAQVSAYHNRFDGFIYLVDTGEFIGEDEEEPLPVRQWTQADARFRGLEAEATFTLADNHTGRWKLRLLADTVRGELREGGGNLPRIAPGRAGAELKWSNSHWRANLMWLRYARQDDVAIDETETPGYNMVDANLAYHWDVGQVGWEAFLSGRNLTDADARVHTSFLKDVVQLPGRGFSAGLRVYF